MLEYMEKWYKDGIDVYKRQCKSFALIAGNLFLVSLQKANAYYDALLSRGYDGKLEFLSEVNPPAGHLRKETVRERTGA